MSGLTPRTETITTLEAKVEEYKGRIEAEKGKERKKGS